MIEIKEFVQAVEYVKRAECVSYARLESIKKMLGCRLIDVMDYIDRHPMLVYLEERYKYKDKIVTSIVAGCRFKDTVKVKIGSLGLCVIDAFMQTSDNWWTDEGLESMIEKNKNRIWVDEDSYYVPLGLYIDKDVKPDSLKSDERYKDARQCCWLWRNTEEKIKKILDSGIAKPGFYWHGGYNDAYKSEHDIVVNDIQLLEIQEKLNFEIIKPK